MNKIIALSILFLSTTTYADEIKIQYMIKENVEIKPGDVRQFNDAIYFSEKQWSNRDDRVIQQMRDARVSSWKDSLLNPPASVEPTKEELEARRANVQEIADQLDAAISLK